MAFPQKQPESPPDIMDLINPQIIPSSNMSGEKSVVVLEQRTSSSVSSALVQNNSPPEKKLTAAEIQRRKISGLLNVS